MHSYIRPRTDTCVCPNMRDVCVYEQRKREKIGDKKVIKGEEGKEGKKTLPLCQDCKAATVGARGFQGVCEFFLDLESKVCVF
jgi:hypothetical protein